MYHFIGIKGSGMSALAIIMKKLEYDVQGSDYTKKYFTEKDLRKNNIKMLPFNKDNIKDNMIIVKGNSFDIENEEVQEAIKRNLKIIDYQDMVSIITNNYNLISVSGCHGKTTTSSLLSHVIESNYLIGDGSGNITKSNDFVLESCEYKKHFLKYNPKYIIITNIDLDHVDYYKDIGEVLEAYQEFVNKAEILIINGDDLNTSKIKHKNIITYGLNKNNIVTAQNIKYLKTGTKFDLYINNKYIDTFKIKLYGSHMVQNTLSVLAYCYLKNMDMNKVKERLKTFKGAKRRFKTTKIQDNIIIDDYAHHPNEIKAVIESTRQKYPNKKIIAYFEPHTYSRTKKFAKSIAKELNKCDYAYVTDIYHSREKQEDYLNITSNIILNELNNGEYIRKGDISPLLKYKNSVILFMSPNDLISIENEYKKSKIEKNEN